jgi:hypothetical protein
MPTGINSLRPNINMDPWSSVTQLGPSAEKKASHQPPIYPDNISNMTTLFNKDMDKFLDHIFLEQEEAPWTRSNIMEDLL